MNRRRFLRFLLATPIVAPAAVKAMAAAPLPLAAPVEAGVTSSTSVLTRQHILTAISKLRGGGVLDDSILMGNEEQWTYETWPCVLPPDHEGTCSPGAAAPPGLRFMRSG